MLATCSTVGLVSGLMSPFSIELSIDHCVRFGSRPSLTDQTQFLVSTPMAYSTASFGFLVASTIAAIPLAGSLYIVRLASIIAATASRSSGRSRSIQASDAP